MHALIHVCLCAHPATNLPLTLPSVGRALVPSLCQPLSVLVGAGMGMPGRLPHPLEHFLVSWAAQVTRCPHSPGCEHLREGGQRGWGKARGGRGSAQHPVGTWWSTMSSSQTKESTLFVLLMIINLIK